MKNNCILIILIFAFSFNAFTQTLQNSGTTQNLNSLFFINENTGWVVGDSGTVLKTTNSGIDWQSHNCDTTMKLFSVFFLDNNIGWIGGMDESSPSVLLKTINGGDTWQKLQYSGLYEIIQIKFFNESVGWIIENSGDFGGRIRKTINGGQNWNTIYSHENNVNEFYFFCPDTGWISGTRFVKKTFDGGNTLIPIDQNLPEEVTDGIHLFGTFFLDKNIGWVVSPSGSDYIYKTGDGGSTWINYDAMLVEYLGCYFQVLKFLDLNNGMTVVCDYNIFDGSFTSIFLITENSGQTFEAKYAIECFIRDIFLLNQNNCWAVGDSGTIVNFSTGITTGIETEPINKKIRLKQNYPNPFNTLTKIHYTIPVSGFVTLKIYNPTGQVIETLVNGFQIAGVHEITWQPKGLPSGIYFYRLQVGEYYESKKLILGK